MIKRVLISAVLVSAIFVFTAADCSHSSKYYSEVKEESIHKDLRFSNPEATKSLIVDNVNGAIHVNGYDGTAVQIEIMKTIRARSKNDMELAGKEVVLKISEKNNRIELYIDGPFRDSGSTTQSRRYSVHFDFQIKVPNACDLELKTINNGDIRVENVHG